MVLQGFHLGLKFKICIKGVFQICYSSVTGRLQGYYKDATEGLQGFCKGVTGVLTYIFFSDTGVSYEFYSSG